MVNVYSNDNCIACKMTEKVMAMNHIEFNHDKLRNHPDLVGRAKREGYMSAPYVTVTADGKIVKDWAGFQPEKIQSLND